jgi:hypothetical protein
LFVRVAASSGKCRVWVGAGLLPLSMLRGWLIRVGVVWASASVLSAVGGGNLGPRSRVRRGCRLG